MPLPAFVLTLHLLAPSPALPARPALRLVADDGPVPELGSTATPTDLLKEFGVGAAASVGVDLLAAGVGLGLIFGVQGATGLLAGVLAMVVIDLALSPLAAVLASSLFAGPGREGHFGLRLGLSYLGKAASLALVALGFGLAFVGLPAPVGVGVFSLASVLAPAAFEVYLLDRAGGVVSPPPSPVAALRSGSAPVVALAF